MKKVLKFFCQLLGVSKEPIIKKLVDNGGELLEKFAVKNPTQASALVGSLYVLIDTVAEDEAEKSKNKWDDTAVSEAKKELEEFAGRHGLTLINLDAD